MSHGVLLLHGFTATPECLDSLATVLREKDFLVSAPLLRGHGTTASDLAKTTWKDWYEGVEEEFQTLHNKTGRVSVAGLSLGGLLVLRLALAHPNKVDRLALLATPVFLSGLLAKFVLPMIGNTPLQYLYPYQAKWAGPAIADPEARANFKSYTKMPIRGIMEILRLQREVAPLLPKIKAPTLILHSPHDTTAPYQNMTYLKERLGSKRIETVTLERSNHVLTMDYEKNLVARKVAQFFGDNS